MDTASINAYYQTPSWRTKLKWKLLPYNHCEVPEVEFKAKDCFVMEITGYISIMDRIKLLFTGKVIVSTKTVTENELGKHKTNSTISISC